IVLATSEDSEEEISEAGVQAVVGNAKILPQPANSGVIYSYRISFKEHIASLNRIISLLIDYEHISLKEYSSPCFKNK
ncbi:MAG: hypothetical protein Q8859_02370, partial [Bacteroidota bacterium]|nr:hypothetical protein [Bacteroidota bacterium]